jgi:cytochrome b561
MTIDTVPTSAPKNWDLGLQSLHWLMATLIPAAWLLAVLREDMPREIAGRLMFFHKSIGALVFLLVLVRILWRLSHTAPEPEKTPWEPYAHLLASAGHGLLYLLMFAVPLGGILTSLLGGRPVPFFGLTEFALPIAPNRDLAKTIAGAHEFAGHLLLLVAFAHAAAGIFHQVVLKDRTLLKMKPFARR